MKPDPSASSVSMRTTDGITRAATCASESVAPAALVSFADGAGAVEGLTWRVWLAGADAFGVAVAANTEELGAWLADAAFDPLSGPSRTIVVAAEARTAETTDTAITVPVPAPVRRRGGRPGPNVESCTDRTLPQHPCGRGVLALRTAPR